MNVDTYLFDYHYTNDTFMMFYIVVGIYTHTSCIATCDYVDIFMKNSFVEISGKFECKKF